MDKGAAKAERGTPAPRGVNKIKIKYSATLHSSHFPYSKRHGRPLNLSNSPSSSRRNYETDSTKSLPAVFSTL